MPSWCVWLASTVPTVPTSSVHLLGSQAVSSLISTPGHALPCLVLGSCPDWPLPPTYSVFPARLPWHRPLTQYCTEVLQAPLQPALRRALLPPRDIFDGWVRVRHRKKSTSTKYRHTMSGSGTISCGIFRIVRSVMSSGIQSLNLCVAIHCCCKARARIA